VGVVGGVVFFFFCVLGVLFFGFFFFFFFFFFGLFWGGGLGLGLWGGVCWGVVGLLLVVGWGFWLGFGGVGGGVFFLGWVVGGLW